MNLQVQFAESDLSTFGSYNHEVSLEEFDNNPNNSRPITILYGFTFEQLIDIHTKIVRQMEQLISAQSKNKASQERHDLLNVRFFNALQIKMAIKQNIETTKSEQLKKLKQQMAFPIQLDNLNTFY